MYTVKAGDTLSKIAKAYGMAFEQLLNANPQYRAHPDGIRVGDQVNIPLSAGQVQEAANWLGTLSAKYETGGRGPGTVSSGVGDAGGVSYGSYQMTSKGGGTVRRFISQPDFPWRDEFQNLIPGSENFTANLWCTVH